MRRLWTIGALGLALMGWTALPVAAQEAGAAWNALAAELRADQQAHLWRVGAWGAANVAGGVLLLTLSDRDARALRGFGLQSAAWGAVNVGIATVGLVKSGLPPETLLATLDAEAGYGRILLFNLGLNVAYSGVGATMVIASHRGVKSAEAWRGHGWALVMQGAGLFVLDGVAYLASKGRLDALGALLGAASFVASPEGVGLAVRW